MTAAVSASFVSVMAQWKAVDETSQSGALLCFGVADGGGHTAALVRQ